MEAVKVWGISTCVAVIIGSVVAAITPSIGKQNIMRIVISAFVLVGLISPSLKLIEKSEINLEEYLITQANVEIDGVSELEQDLLKELEQASAVALFPIFKQELENIGINSEFGIKPQLYQEKEGIEIIKVNITISDLHMIEKEAVLNHLQNKTGLEIDIDVTESEDISKNE
ncbi:MAG: hypothetical protein UHH95_02950 [Oscillospiraceae bacterium]|nr:hypothetical protein [Oscillospiraceae bacterium]